MTVQRCESTDAQGGQCRMRDGHWLPHATWDRVWWRDRTGFDRCAATSAIGVWSGRCALADGHQGEHLFRGDRLFEAAPDPDAPLEDPMPEPALPANASWEPEDWDMRDLLYRVANAVVGEAQGPLSDADRRTAARVLRRLPGPVARWLHLLPGDDRDPTVTPVPVSGVEGLPVWRYATDRAGGDAVRSAVVLAEVDLVTPRDRLVAEALAKAAALRRSMVGDKQAADLLEALAMPEALREA